MLYHIAEKSFILAAADWSAHQLRQLVETLEPSHVIVAMGETTPAYYLFAAQAIKHLLNAAAEPALPLFAALHLADHSPTPLLDIYDDEINAPDRAVILEAGSVFGFIDTMVPPTYAAGVKRGDLSPQPSSSLTRTVMTDLPSQVLLGDEASLLVSLSAQLIDGKLQVNVAPGTILDVIVQPRRGFELIGAREASIVVTDEEETLAVRFKLKATALGAGIILVQLFQGSYSLGRITLEAQVVDKITAQSTSHQQPLTHNLPDIGIGVKVLEPDLSLIITEHRVSGELYFTFTLKTGDHYTGDKFIQPFGPIKLNDLPRDYFRAFFRNIETLPLYDAQAKANALELLERRGADLFKRLFPDDLRRSLWTQRHHIRTVQVLSDDPWIPWELCKLSGWEGDQIQEGPFFCQAFAMSRWLPKLSAKPKLKLSNIALVVPPNSGLHHAADERQYLLNLGSASRQVTQVDATRQAVLKAFKSGEYDGWHFTCHGETFAAEPYHSALKLEGNDPLTPDNLSGIAANVGRPQPLVFLNACQTGQGVLALTGIGGWAEKFLTAAYEEVNNPQGGASSFIGAFWKIDDHAAYQFARAFYDSLLAEDEHGQKRWTIAEAVRKARSAIQPLQDLTWLAYTVFAHPLAKVE